MFGYGITIFKKKKGINIEPEKPVQKKPVVDEEYEKWKREEAAKRYKENRDHNWELISKYINEKLDKHVDSFKSRVPQPFQVGEMVTYRHYGPHGNPFHIGYFSGPSECAELFDAPDLAGPFTFPVHKIKVSTELLEDKLRDRMPWQGHDTKYTEMEAEQIANRAWSEVMNIQRQYSYWVEWILDFDWETLKIPAGKCANDEGWLNLRWGGFNTGHFMSADTPMAKKQRKLWKKEKTYKEQKARFEQELEKLKGDFEAAKNNLI